MNYKLFRSLLYREFISDIRRLRSLGESNAWNGVKGVEAGLWGRVR